MIRGNIPLNAGLWYRLSDFRKLLLFELSNCLMFSIKASPLHYLQERTRITTRNFQTQTLYISLTHTLATTDWVFYIDIARSYSSDASGHAH